MNSFVAKWTAEVILSTQSFIREGKTNFFLIQKHGGYICASSSLKLRNHSSLYYEIDHHKKF